MKQPQLTEQTAKRWKAMQVAGFASFSVGAAVAYITDDTRSAAWAFGFALALAGFLAVLLGQALAWWHHG